MQRNRKQKTKDKFLWKCKRTRPEFGYHSPTVVSVTDQPEAHATRCTLNAHGRATRAYPFRVKRYAIPHTAGPQGHTAATAGQTRTINKDQSATWLGIMPLL
jgi:hypothetical protein